MKTILLVCSAGMSTSLLVTKMESAAKEAGPGLVIQRNFVLKKQKQNKTKQR